MRTDNDTVLVVADEAEAQSIQIDDGVIPIIVSQGAASVEGMRIGEARWTLRAIQHPLADEVFAVIERSRLMCGR